MEMEMAEAVPVDWEWELHLKLEDCQPARRRRRMKRHRDPVTHISIHFPGTHHILHESYTSLETESHTNRDNHQTQDLPDSDIATFLFWFLSGPSCET